MTSLPGKPEWRRTLLAARRGRAAEALAEARATLGGHLLDALGGPPLLNASSDLLVSAAQEEAADLRSDALRLPAPPPAARRPGNNPTQPTICAYLPLDSEPLPPDLPRLLTARGWRVLLPLAVPGEPLDWAELESGDDIGARPDESAVHDRPLDERRASELRFRRSSIGVLEPTGPRLGSHAVLSASVVLVPALAVDMSGFRLGRGGGFYDRTLALLDRVAPAPPERASTHRQGPTPPPAGDVISGVASAAREQRPATIAVVFDDELIDALPHEPHDARVSHVATPAGGVRPITAARADTA